MVDKVKSNLQKRLEHEGWRFLTNTDLETLREPIGTFGLNDSPKPEPLTVHSDTKISPRFTKKPREGVEDLAKKYFRKRSDGELRGEYLRQGFEDVLVSDAYDINAHPLLDLRAIYVKGQVEETGVKIGGFA